MYYHLVVVVKYRRKVFDDKISNRAKEIFEYISPKYSITLQEWNHDKDHVHILFKAHPNTEISKFINAYKMERMFLESKFLSADNRRDTDRSYQKIYRKPG